MDTTQILRQSSLHFQFELNLDKNLNHEDIIEVIYASTLLTDCLCTFDHKLISLIGNPIVYSSPELVLM